MAARVALFVLVVAFTDPRFVGRGGRKGSTMVPFERAMVVSYRLSIVTNAISLTIGIWERHGALVCKKNLVNIFGRLSTMHERDRQTDKKTDHGTVTSIAIGNDYSLLADT